MRPVFIALKVDHAIYTSERGAMASTPVGIELLLREDITAGLQTARTIPVSIGITVVASVYEGSPRIGKRP